MYGEGGGVMVDCVVFVVVDDDWVTGISNTSWPAALRAETVRERARAQAGEGSTTPSVRRTPMRRRLLDLIDS